MIRSAFAALLALGFTASAHAETLEDLDRLDARVQQITGVPIGEPGGAITAIDRRLRLPSCPEPASIAWEAQDTVAIRCASLGWRLRVGVARLVSARAEVMVHKGDHVEATVEGEAFDVTTTAIALDDGAKGASIRLKIGEAGTQSSAIVTGPGTVSFSR
jgi:flagella basal body P-ring formation protein FlgA